MRGIRPEAVVVAVWWIAIGADWPIPFRQYLPFTSA